MAKASKQSTPPLSREISAPKALVPLMEAFHVDSEKAAKALILDAAKAISSPNDRGYINETQFDDDDIASITALMKALSPRDGLETLYAAQIVATHMLGIRKLASPLESDQRLGLKMLRFSNDAMQQLEKKRGGVVQNITVNYNYTGSQTILNGG